MVSMANETLGFYGKSIAWIAYMLLLYSLISAYLTASTAWLKKLLVEYYNIQLASELSVTILAAVMGVVIFFGTAAADRINRLLAFTLLISYGILIAIGTPNVDIGLLYIGKLTSMPATIPLIITTFGFCIVVPSLTHYFNRDSRSLLYVVIIGSIIPLLIYLAWEFITLGTLAIDGPYGLAALANSHADGTQVAYSFEQVIGHPWISMAAKVFSISAILTSLIGVSLCLFHFLADGLQVSKSDLSGFKLFLLTFMPPVLLVIFYPAAFNHILSFAGIFVAILLGLLPVTMAWSGRYNTLTASGYRVFGDKFLLIITGLFFVYVILQELCNVVFS